ncbi:hypothetical protein ABVT39_014065 [Epinephelus coioides]
MDCALNRLLGRYVLTLMLLGVQSRPVVPAPTPTSCDVNRTKNILDQLKVEVNNALDEYDKKNGVRNGSDRDDVPTSTVSGTNISEKLQDIYIKNVIFHSHISKVQGYQGSDVTSLSQVKGSLRRHSDTVKAILIHINSLPTTAAPPQPSPSHDYAKKQYGRAVLVSLRDWLIQVEQESVLVMSDNLSGVRMKYRAGFLTALCTWMVILLQSSDSAGHALKKHAAGDSCKPKELTALTKSLVEESLKDFDKANGEHLGTWSPGFPQLKVHQNSSADGSKVQCSLLFMAQGLGKVLDDQKNNLNPTDVSLHEKLKNAISTVNMLTVCVKDVLGGACSEKPAPPTMPRHTFDRKQWSHTLLKTARDYLAWLESKFVVHIPKVKEKSKIKHKGPEATHKKHLVGSGYLL